MDWAETKSTADAALARGHAGLAVLLLWEVDEMSPRHVKEMRERALAAAQSAPLADAGAGSESVAALRDVVEAAVLLQRWWAGANVAGCDELLRSMRGSAVSGSEGDQATSSTASAAEASLLGLSLASKPRATAAHDNRAHTPAPNQHTDTHADHIASMRGNGGSAGKR